MHSRDDASHILLSLPKGKPPEHSFAKPDLRTAATPNSQNSFRPADIGILCAETALSFSAIALETEDLSKKQRNCRNARKGYDTIRRLAGRVELSPDDEQFLSERLLRLKSELLRPGEVF